MLTSAYISSLAAAYNYNQRQRRTLTATGANNAAVSTNTVNVVVAVIVAIEFFLMIWAVWLALECGRRHQDRLVHVVLAFGFPLFYIIYYYWTGCGSFTGCGIY